MTSKAKIARRQRTCQTCGMVCADGGEYHPYEFCLIYRAGRNPWDVVERFARDLKLGRVPRGILVQNLPAKDEAA